MPGPREHHLTGLLALDRHTAGLSPGILTVWGGSGSGKSAYALSILRVAADEGHPALYIGAADLPDVFHRSVPSRVPIMATKPPSPELAIHLAHKAIERGVRAVVLDSIPVLEPSCDARLSIGDNNFPAQRKFLYHCLRQLQSAAKMRNALVIALNDVRANVDGGRRPRAYLHDHMYYLSDHVIFTKRQGHKNQYGKRAETRCTATLEQLKNKSTDFTTELMLWPGVGVKRPYEVLQYLQSTGQLRRAGIWWRDGENNLYGPGYQEAVSQIGRRARDPEYCRAIFTQIRKGTYRDQDTDHHS